MKYQVLLKQQGENSTTSRDPVAEVVSVDGDTVTVRRHKETYTVSLKEQKTCCLSFDNDMLIQVDKYALGEVETPDWMTCDEYLSYQTELKWYLGFGALPTWPRQWFFRLTRLGEAPRFTAIKLLKVQKFRSNFRMSLRSQLEAWLNDPNPEYESPFSRKQWDALLDVYTCRDAANRSKALYWSR
jgi:hypothetical protein